jgi:hypothetical protein
MKYIIEVKKEQNRIRKFIEEIEGIKVKANLFTGSESSSMWIIFDETTLVTSFFNVISKERKDQYRVIVIHEGIYAFEAFMAIFARIRKIVSLKTKLTNSDDDSACHIIGYEIFISTDGFNELFADNDFRHPLVVGHANLVFEEYTSLITPSKSTAPNFAILTLKQFKFDERNSAKLLYILHANISSFNIKDEEVFFGCKITDYIKESEDGCVKFGLTNFLTGKSLHDTARALKRSATRGGVYEFAIVKQKGKSIVLSLDDFLASIDVNEKIMRNMLKSMTGCKVHSNETLQFNSMIKIGSNCTYSNTLLGTDLLSLTNILELNNFKFSLKDGSSSGF